MPCVSGAHGSSPKHGADADVRSSGAEQKAREKDEETADERRMNREAASSATEFAAERARKAAAHAEQMREGKKAEAQERKKQAAVTWKQKVCDMVGYL